MTFQKTRGVKGMAQKHYQSLDDFQILNPLDSSFEHEIRVKSLQDWNYEYIDFGKGVGYWRTESPFYGDGFERFRDFVGRIPIRGLNNTEGSPTNNPFARIRLPLFAYADLSFLLADFWRENIGRRADPSPEDVDGWSNIYDYRYCRPLKRWILPHTDGDNGLIGSLWFTKHPLGETGTKLYHYHGEAYGDDIWEYMKNPKHPKYDTFYSWGEEERHKEWIKISAIDAMEWGFEELGMISPVPGGMALYKSQIPHTAYLKKSVKFRWSHHIFLGI